MDLGTATPREIDEAIADLETKAWEQRAIIEDGYETLHHAVGDRQRSQGRLRVWTKSDQEARAAVEATLDDDSKQVRFLIAGGRDKVKKALAAIDAATAERDRLDGQVDRHEDEYRRRPWSRFHQLRSTNNARIHGTRWCQGLHRSNHADLGWHPQLSGKSEAEAVEELGPVMCSKCFPSAPVEWRRDPKDLRVDPDGCNGENEYAVKGTVTRQSNWSGVRYYGKCPKCLEVKLLKSGNKLPKHKKPKTGRKTN